MQSVLTSISEPENNVSDGGSMATLMHRGFERAADRFGDRDAVGWGTSGGLSATTTASPTRSPATWARTVSAPVTAWR